MLYCCNAHYCALLYYIVMRCIATYAYYTVLIHQTTIEEKSNWLLEMLHSRILLHLLPYHTIRSISSAITSSPSLLFVFNLIPCPALHSYDIPSPSFFLSLFHAFIHSYLPNKFSLVSTLSNTLSGRNIAVSRSSPDPRGDDVTDLITSLTTTFF